jgi:hypothetical protein
MSRWKEVKTKKEIRKERKKERKKERFSCTSRSLLFAFKWVNYIPKNAHVTLPKLSCVLKILYHAIF